MAFFASPHRVYWAALLLWAAQAAAQNPATLPAVGDSWSYRYSDGYGKTGNYTVKVTAVSVGEIEDEASLGKIRHTTTFGPGIETTTRNLGPLPVREISPYLQSLGPFDGSSEWKKVNILGEGETFNARLVGKETVEVPAGTFEAHKLVIRGGQNLVGESAQRPYYVTAWYAPAVKRFVKLTFVAHTVAGGYFPGDKDSIELLEFRVR